MAGPTFTSALALASGTNGGEGKQYKSLPAGYMAGPAGAGPCILLIIVSPPNKAGLRDVWTFHFNSGDDPNTTLNRNGPFPKGSHAVIAGGQNGERISNGTLQSVETYLNKNKANITVDGLYNSPGIWVDSNGNYFVHTRERKNAEKDGTAPTPLPGP